MLPEISLREGKIQGKWNRKFFKPDQKDKNGSAWKIVRVAKIHIQGETFNITEKEYESLLKQDKNISKKIQTEIITNFEILNAKEKIFMLLRLLPKINLSFETESKLLYELTEAYENIK